MKRLIGQVVALAALILLAAGAALADDDGTWVHSRQNGWIQLTTYASEYNGYEDVDGLGGVTSADAHTVSVISKSASIWSKARTGSKKLGSASHGETLTCVADGEGVVREGSFYAVKHKKQTGWVNEDYVVLNDLTITLLESNVPAYIAPDRSSKKVGSLSKLTSYRVIGFYDDFYIVNLRGAAAAYIPVDVLHRDNTFDRYYHAGRGIGEAVTDGKVKLRTGPGKAYPEIRTLKSGTRVQVRDVLDGWYMIEDEGDWAFIAPEDLSGI